MSSLQVTEQQQEQEQQVSRTCSLEDHIVMKKLSSSKYSVYKAYNNKLDQKVALKVFPFVNGHSDKNYDNEKKCASELDHPNIIKVLQTSDNSSATIERDQKEVSYICYEYASKGDLFEMISNKGRMPEVLARTLFHNLVEAVEYIHSKGIAHLDLKLENLMFDKDFNLKVIDFDLSQPLDSTSLLAKGTAGYRAPEVKRGICCDLTSADVYSLGVILFIMLTGSPPYAEINRGFGYEFDGFYRVMRKDNKRFWELHLGGKNQPDLYSGAFKELINSMWVEEPRQRATISDIKSSEWYQGPILKKESYVEEMKKYMQKTQ